MSIISFSYDIDMTCVDFYILGQAYEEDRLKFACRLAEKAYSEGCNVYLHTADELHANKLDEAMWTFKPESFLPHSLVNAKSSADKFVQIGWQDHPNHHHDVMINLSSPLPSFFSRFERVLEIVIQDDRILKQTRDHYKFYKDRGYRVVHRDLRG